MITKALRKVFSEVSYAVLTSVMFVVVLLLILWLPNLHFVAGTLFSGKTSFGEKISFVLATFWTLKTNFSFWSALATIFIALLFAVNCSLLIYYIKRKKSLLGSGGANVFGLLAGLLGTGCASCGSIILSVIGLSGVAIILPLGGQEFSVLAIGLLLFSLHSISKKIISDNTCN